MAVSNAMNELEAIAITAIIVLIFDPKCHSLMKFVFFPIALKPYLFCVLNSSGKIIEIKCVLVYTNETHNMQMNVSF